MQKGTKNFLRNIKTLFYFKEAATRRNKLFYPKEAVTSSLSLLSHLN